MVSYWSHKSPSMFNQPSIGHYPCGNLVGRVPALNIRFDLHLQPVPKILYAITWCLEKACEVRYWCSCCVWNLQICWGKINFFWFILIKFHWIFHFRTFLDRNVILIVQSDIRGHSTVALLHSPTVTSQNQSSISDIVSCSLTETDRRILKCFSI